MVYLKNNYNKSLIIVLILCFFSFVYCTAQDTIKQDKYSLEIQVFANFGYNKISQYQSEFTYNTKRTLLIYKQEISPKFSFCLAGDTYLQDNQKPFNLSPYLKRAYLQYHNKGVSLTAGLLVLEQFKYQRQIWQLRYIDKTFQNKFKYGENRNIGLLVKHKVSKSFSYDFAITSGYSTPKPYYSEKYSLMAGQTFKTRFCTFRLFNNISIDSNYEHIVSLVVNKGLGKSDITIELAKKTTNMENGNMYGFSVFGNSYLSNDIMIFGRLDINKKAINLQFSNIIYTGIQYTINDNIRSSIFYKNEDFSTHFYGLSFFYHYI